MSTQQVLTGFHAVTARLRHAPESIHEIYVDAGRRDQRMRAFTEMLKQTGVRVIAVDNVRLDGLARGVRHQGVVALVTALDVAQDIHGILDALEDKGQPALLLLLDGVTDPHNLGACLRTADAAGVHAVIAPRDRAVGLNATVHRVACGAAETVPYIMVTNLARTMRDLKKRDIWLVGTDDQARGDIYQVDGRRAMAWVMGAEGEGLRRLTRETCDELAHIPMAGAVESLNVSVASALCMYETLRQRRGA